LKATYALLKIEIILGIVITNILDQLAYPWHIGRKFALLDLGPEKVAKDPSEIFMSGEG
tara:strand:+ start:909 stop:1085 length:177 start_codon:yes stop_codon:yes gene_type:complete